MDDKDLVETTKSEMKRRVEDCKVSIDILTEAIVSALDAEIAYLEAALAVMVATGDPQKLAKEFTKRVWFLRRKRSLSNLSSAARKIVDASPRRRWLDF